MNSRVISVALTTIMLVLAVGCSATSGPKSPSQSRSSTAAAPQPSTINPSALPESPTPLPVVASGDADPDQNAYQQLPSMNTADLKLSVNSAKRDSSGIVTVTWTITNDSNHTFNDFVSLWDSVNGYRGQSVSNVQIVDEAKRVQYYPLVDSDTNCYCSRGGQVNDQLETGASRTYSNMFKPEQATTKVDVKVAGFKPAKNVPIN